MPSKVPMSFLLARFLNLELRSSREVEAEGSKAGAMDERWYLWEAVASPDRDSLAGVLPMVA